LRKNPSTLIFGIVQLSPLLGILIGLTQPEKAAGSPITIPYSACIGRGIKEHTPEFLVTLKNLATVKDITV
jgi:hypothetical protein